jgi:arylsulfatase A-like enzyme
MTPFANYKGSAAEGGVRAPFIIRYPPAIAQGGRVDRFAYVQDVVPTLLELAGVTPPHADAPIAGRSMMGVLSGKTAQIHGDTDPVGYEAAGGAALYRGDYKLVRSVPPYGDRAWRLYDLRTDPTESHDLTATQPDLARAMSAAFADYVAHNGVVMVPDDYNVFDQAQKNTARTQ